MKSFRISSDNRNKSNVLKLRMRLGAAGYGVYIMILERLAAEPTLSAELDFDVLAYDFHVEAELIRQVVEDFDLFIIDLDALTFSNDELNRQLTPKAEKARQEKILDEFIARRNENANWLQSMARTYSLDPERIHAILQTTFRQHILTHHPRIPDSQTLNTLLATHLKKTRLQ